MFHDLTGRGTPIVGGRNPPPKVPAILRLRKDCSINSRTYKGDTLLYSHTHHQSPHKQGEI